MDRESRYDHRRFSVDGRRRAALKPVSAYLVDQAKGGLAASLFGGSAILQSSPFLVAEAASDALVALIVITVPFGDL